MDTSETGTALGAPATDASPAAAPLAPGPALLDAPETEAGSARPSASAELPLVSVVVPVLDAVDEIDRLLDSLEALEYPRDRLEILVVDNGSRDGTFERIARRPVRLLRETRVRSSYAARNRGVEAASGEWVAFTDADCVATPGWLARLLAPGVPDAVGAVAGEVLAYEARTPVQRLTERYGIMKHAVTMPHKALPGFSTANVAIRRELLRALGGFREDVRFFGDMELSWRMQIVAGVRLLFRPEAVVLHRHRRTWRALWRHGRQHGRGVAFMKSVYPDRYAIRLGEQLGRIGAIGTGRAVGAGPAFGPRRSAHRPHHGIAGRRFRTGCATASTRLSFSLSGTVEWPWATRWDRHGAARAAPQAKRLHPPRGDPDDPEARHRRDLHRSRSGRGRAAPLLQAEPGRVRGRARRRDADRARDGRDPGGNVPDGQPRRGPRRAACPRGRR